MPIEENVTFHPRSRSLSESEMPGKQEIIAASIEILGSMKGCFRSTLINSLPTVCYFDEGVENPGRGVRQQRYKL
jgi:hypothetical protein